VKRKVVEAGGQPDKSGKGPGVVIRGKRGKTGVMIFLKKIKEKKRSEIARVWGGEQPDNKPKRRLGHLPPTS